MIEEVLQEQHEQDRAATKLFLLASSVSACWSRALSASQAWIRLSVLFFDTLRAFKLSQLCFDTLRLNKLLILRLGFRCWEAAEEFFRLRESSL